MSVLIVICASCVAAMLSAASRATLTPLSCSPNFLRAQYLDIRTLTHELIVKFHMFPFR